MKKILAQLTGMVLLATTGAYAQTEVTAGLMQGKDYGVTYMLPKTEIEITLQATKHQYTPGELCKYAERYLRQENVLPEPREYWTLEAVKAEAVGVPDEANIYFVKLKDKTVAPLMELTPEGIVRSINMPYSGGSQPVAAPVPAHPLTNPDPRLFLTEEILMASSVAKKAELIAKEIYAIRESRNALLRGEADNMPKDGAQLKLMLDNLAQQETVLTGMFIGNTVTEAHTFTIRIAPKEMDKEIACRFSRKMGLVDNEDLAGAPIYITVNNLKSLPLQPATEKDVKKVEGIAYNVPGRGRVTLTYQQKNIFEGEVPLTQFGTVEYLAPVLFNKTNVTKVVFDTVTGGLLKVDRGE